MLTLCGFGASNYHNKVKLALLEKGLAFEEELVWVGETDAEASPLGKVPYLKTAQGSVCESAVMVEYIEQQYPEHPLVPKDAFQAAKVRELVTFLDLHLELVARNLYPEAFFGGKVSDSVKEKIGAQLEKNVAAFAKLVQFKPFIGGTEIMWIAIVVLVLFGAKKVPELMKGVGTGIREFKKASKDVQDEVQRVMDEPERPSPPPSSSTSPEHATENLSSG